MFDIICLVSVIFGIVGMIMTNDLMWFIIMCFGAAVMWAKDYGQKHPDEEA